MQTSEPALHSRGAGFGGKSQAIADSCVGVAVHKLRKMRRLVHQSSRKDGKGLLLMSVRDRLGCPKTFVYVECYCLPKEPCWFLGAR